MADPNNAFIALASSGAKGSAINFANISSLLGQQNVNGERTVPNLSGNRTLPIFEPNTKSAQSRGFCPESFYNGIGPKSWSSHSASVRENLADTAVGTRTTGELEHLLIKANEDAHISQDGAIKITDGSIISFIYGEDGMSPASLTRFKIHGQNQLLFRNIPLAAFQLKL